jgi:hypothetical protein
VSDNIVQPQSEPDANTPISTQHTGSATVGDAVRTTLAALSSFEDVLMALGTDELAEAVASEDSICLALFFDRFDDVFCAFGDVVAAMMDKPDRMAGQPDLTDISAGLGAVGDALREVVKTLDPADSRHSIAIN